MIILSQDKKRISENLEISVCPVYADETDENIVRWSIENDYIEMGVYETEERAMQVLNDIWSKLCDKREMYRMPEK